jgi:hypothetical protein
LGIVPFSKPVENGRLYFDKERLDEWLLSNASPGDHERKIAAETYTNTH